MTDREEAALRERVRAEWDDESVGPCPADHPSTHEAEKACPFCSTIIELCRGL